MAYQKLQVGLAIPVVPNDSVDIPNAAGAIFSGAVASVSTNTITVTGALFLSMSLQNGMAVQNDAGTALTTIVSVDSDTQITLASATGFASSDTFKIFTDENLGCVLYVGGGTVGEPTVAADIAIVTSSGSEVILKRVLPGSFIPVQVKRVKSTGTTVTDILAFW